MEAFEAIHGRRSIRRYTAQPVAEEMVEKLLRAAMAAPSAGNQQPWQFVVIDDRATLNAIPQFHPYSAMLREAPLAIVICGDERQEKYKGYWVQDCSAATQNLLLAAHALGLGAVWLGVYPLSDRVAKTQELLGLPSHVIPLAIVAVGHPAEKKGPEDRFQASRVHRNRWSG
jgi:nitroreductase